VGGFIHRGLSHQDKHGAFVRHSAAHTRHMPEILLLTLNPVGGIEHGVEGSS